MCLYIIVLSFYVGVLLCDERGWKEYNKKMFVNVLGGIMIEFVVIVICGFLFIVYGVWVI